RILIENINAKIKVFKITANKYRNHRKRFALRMSLICGIINFENRN
ncbi:MAG: IS5/IS1182 family transposase, partial [Synergistaceae bacterium]|nr:IS5/IS1182 family transposase [Synergistaceae bacterium]